MEAETIDEKVYLNLRQKYLLVFLTACFADWLQGPYIYKLYSTYGYNGDDISVLFVTGFASSTIFGIAVGYLADRFGRKILCICYCVLYSLSCLTKVSRNFKLLMSGRILGGISTSILFSTFESWYVGQHLTRYRLDQEWLNRTLSWATFYNGLLAITAGLVSSLIADTMVIGPIAPFILAVPVLVVSGCFCAVYWEESKVVTSLTLNGFKPISGSISFFSRDNKILLYLGLVQCLFESVMYVFVFLWTPVLEPIEPSHGVVFGLFMFCTMIGSSLFSVLRSRYRIRCENLLKSSIYLSFCSIFVCSLGSYVQLEKSTERLGTYLCFAAFLSFEVAVGIYYPAIGYLRGIVVPDTYRTSITNWFRLPMNFLTCVILLYIRFRVPQNYEVYSISTAGLAVAAISCCGFVKLFNRDSRYHQIGKSAVYLF